MTNKVATSPVDLVQNPERLRAEFDRLFNETEETAVPPELQARVLKIAHKLLEEKRMERSSE